MRWIKEICLLGYCLIIRLSVKHLGDNGIVKTESCILNLCWSISEYKIFLKLLNTEEWKNYRIKPIFMYPIIIILELFLIFPFTKLLEIILKGKYHRYGHIKWKWRIWECIILIIWRSLEYLRNPSYDCQLFNVLKWKQMIL